MSRKDVKTVGLEVQDEGATTGWQSMGEVQLMEDEIPLPSHASREVHRDQLPLSVKRLLAPHTDQRKYHYLFRHARPETQPNTNLLILLHGAGDTHVPFDKLGQTMALPQTATLSISAKGYEKLPFSLGYTWFQEMDYVTGLPLLEHSTLRCRSLQAATNKLYNVLEKLIEKEEWIIPERVFFLGHGAGASLAMQVAVLWSERDHAPLGGAICVGGGAMLEEQQQNNSIDKQRTSILLMVGEKDEVMTSKKMHELKRGYGKDAEVYIEPNKGQGMIQSQREMQQVMEFFSQKLVRVSSMPS